MQFTYKQNEKTLLFFLILNLKFNRHFHTIPAFASYLDITIEEVRNIYEKHNGIYLKMKYTSLTKMYFKNKQDAISCMEEFNTIIISNLLRDDYNV